MAALEATPPPRLNLIIGVTGASGALYTLHFLRALAGLVAGESRLIVSDAALRVYRQETGGTAEDAPAFLREILSDSDLKSNSTHRFVIEDPRDIGAKPASGSAHFDGMVIIPCSMKTLAAVAHGYTANLIERAADVTLKERRRLIVVPRETPYSLIHLRNMTALCEAGAIVLPASPGFYQGPRDLDDLGRFIAGRVLSLFGVRQNLFQAWDPPEK